MKRVSITLVSLFGICMTSIAQETGSYLEDRELFCRELLESLEDSTTNMELMTRTIAGERDRLNEWASKHPNSTAIRRTTGMAYVFAGDFPSALPHLKTAYENSPGDTRIASSYSFALVMNKQPLESLAVNKRLADENPQDITLKFVMAGSLMAVQRYDEAKKALEECRKLAPYTSAKYKAYFIGHIGVCDLYLGNHRQAIASIERAERLKSGDIQRLAPLAEAYIKSGQYSKATQVLTKLLRIEDNYPPALYWSGVLLELQEQSYAEQYFRKALAATKSDFVPRSGHDFHLLNQIYAKLGETEEAVKAEKQAAELHFTFEAPWNER